MTVTRGLGGRALLLLFAGAMAMGMDECDVSDLPNGGGGGGPGAACDIWDADDCGEGSKCIVDDVHQSQPRCRSVVDNPDQVGDPCSTLGANDGDTCDVGGMCLDGVCVEMCSGTPGNPTCNSGGTDGTCYIYDSGTPLCTETCDPLINGSCAGGMKCGPTTGLPAFEFVCMLDESGNSGVQGDSCTLQTQCAQGFACVTALSLDFGFCEGNANQCCTPMCELSAGNGPCPGNLQCTTAFADSPPPGLEDVGICVL